MLKHQKGVGLEADFKSVVKSSVGFVLSLRWINADAAARMNTRVNQNLESLDAAISQIQQKNMTKK